MKTYSFFGLTLMVILVSGFPQIDENDGNDWMNYYADSSELPELQPLDKCSGENCECPPGTYGIQPFCQPNNERDPINDILAEGTIDGALELQPLDKCIGESCECPPGMTGVQPFCQPNSILGVPATLIGQMCAPLHHPCGASFPDCCESAPICVCDRLHFCSCRYLPGPPQPPVKYVPPSCQLMYHPCGTEFQPCCDNVPVCHCFDDKRWRCICVEEYKGSVKQNGLKNNKQLEVEIGEEDEGDKGSGEILHLL